MNSVYDYISIEYICKVNIFDINDFEQLNKIALALAEKYTAPQIFALHGNLGSGKTTFVKSFAKEIGTQHRVTSPTYSLVNEYGENNDIVYHLDLYRLNSIEEALNIGIEEILDHNGYVFIEWPEIIEDLLPDNTINLYFSYSNLKRRLKYE